MLYQLRDINAYKESRLTFFSTSTSSVLAFFSYPGGGNGKQRDIAQTHTIQETSAFPRRKFRNYVRVALFQEGNEPATMHLSMHHAPTFIPSIKTPLSIQYTLKPKPSLDPFSSWAKQTLPKLTKAHQNNQLNQNCKATLN